MGRVSVMSAIAGLAGLACLGTANAAVLSLDLTGSCQRYPHSPPSCANVGLPPGARDVALGSIRLDDAFWIPNSTVEDEGLAGFDFAFGDFALTDKDVRVTNFAVSWGATPGSIFALTLHAYASDDREHPGRLISFGMGNTRLADLVASHDGYSQPILGGQAFETDFGNYAAFEVPVATAPIPLPPTAWLLLAGCAGLAGLRLRRRAGEAA